MFDRAGTSQGFRTFRNNLVFLVADSDSIDHAVDEARRYLAISRIVSDVQRFTQYTKDNQKRLKGMADEAELTLRVAITRMYRLLYYPDAAASEKHGRLSRALLPAQDQGDVDRDQTQIVLRTLRELGKVLTADDPDVAPAFVRQKAWPANAERTTPRQLQKEFASRIGLKILLDVNKLKETIKLGIRANQWLYYDPRKECAYSDESPTSPLVELTDDVELILPEAGAGVPICGKAAPPPTETCPVCGNPQDDCTCAVVPPVGVIEIRSEGASAQAFQQLVDIAQEKSVPRIAALEIRTEGTGAEFARDLLAVALAVPQLPKAEIRVSMSGAFDIDDGSHLKIEYSGPWARYREIHDVLQKAGKGVTDASGYLALGLSFPAPIEVDGLEVGDMRDTFTQLNPGKISIRAVPATEERVNRSRQPFELKVFPVGNTDLGIELVQAANGNSEHSVVRSWGTATAGHQRPRIRSPEDIRIPARRPQTKPARNLSSSQRRPESGSGLCCWQPNRCARSAASRTSHPQSER